MDIKHCSNCGGQCEYRAGHMICRLCGSRFKLDFAKLTTEDIELFSENELNLLLKDIEAYEKRLDRELAELEAENKRLDKKLTRLLKQDEKASSGAQPGFKKRKKRRALSLILILLLLVPCAFLITKFTGFQTNDAIAEIGNFSIGYLTEDVYNDGEFDDSDLTENVIFKNGKPQYMVVDFKIKTLADNGGRESISVVARESDSDAMRTMIEEAPTGKIETTENTDGSRSYHLTYQIPAKKKEEKICRMILKLIPINGNDVDFSISVSGNDGVALTGETLVTHTFRIVLNFELNSDGKSYTVTGVNYKQASNIRIPETLVDGFPVTKIADYAFSDCTSLTTIVVPDSVTSIGSSAFKGCSGLTSIEIPDGVTSIGSYTFLGCNGLTSIEIPDGVTSIGDYAFYCCSGLASIEIPDGVTSIGDYAFYGCINLTNIRFSGTRAQWWRKEISFGSSWNSNTGNYTVTCTDGTISK